jgi:hypothetical protein
MTDELRAARERLRRYGHGDTRVYEYPLEPHMTDLDKVERDRRIVVAADLAAHDPTPVDEAWLRTVGFHADGVHLVLRDWGPDHNGTVQVYQCKAWFLNGSAINRAATRGHVRRLLAALGVTFQESHHA